jgi:hypothetical protein
MSYYKTLLGLETPEPSSSPSVCPDLRKLAEQVDALLRKQLTTLFEVAKLKVTETLELPAESLTTTMLKALAVTAAKLGSEAVETAKIKAGAVTAAKLGNEAVERASIKLKAVGPNQLETGAVGGTQLANESVTDTKVGNGRALMDTENKYTLKAYSEAELLAGIVSSAAHFTHVLTPHTFTPQVGGVELPTIKEGEGFIVPPGVAWGYAKKEISGFSLYTLIF